MLTGCRCYTLWEFKTSFLVPKDLPTEEDEDAEEYESFMALKALMHAPLIEE